MADKEPLMNLSPEEFEEFMAFDEREKWRTIWNALRLLEFSVDNTDDTLVNVCRDIHKTKEKFKNLFENL